MRANILSARRAAAGSRVALDGPWLGEKLRVDLTRVPLLRLKEGLPLENGEKFRVGEHRLTGPQTAVLAMALCCRPKDISSFDNARLTGRVFASSAQYALFSSVFSPDTRWIILEFLTRQFRAENLDFLGQFASVQPAFQFSSPIVIVTDEDGANARVRQAVVAQREVNDWRNVFTALSDQIVKYFTYPGMGTNETPDEARNFMTLFSLLMFTPESLRLLGLTK